MRHFIKCVALLATVTVIGCGTIKNYEAELEAGPAHDEDYPIYVYPPDAEVPRDYEVMGTMTIRDTPVTIYGGSLEKELDALRKKARKVGADALRLTSVQPPGFVHSKYRLDAELIRWEQEWEAVPFSLEEFRAYLEQDPSSLDPLEGVWASSDRMNTRVGIVKSGPREGSQLVAFVIENTNPTWKPGDIKAEINRAITPGEYRGYYYEDDYHRKPMAFRLDKPDSPVFLLKLPDDSAPILFARE
jgi:hypothetical protein